MKATEKEAVGKFHAEHEPLVDRRLYHVPLDGLTPDPDQPRKHFDEEALADLTASIRKHEVLQPIIFRKEKGGRLIIVSGERRFRASQQAKRETIPAIYMEDGNSAEIALVENLLRENLNPIEEAEALQKLKNERSYTNEQISAVIGKAVSTISEILSLNRLPESIKAECRKSPKVSRRALVEIVKTGGEEKMLALFEKYRKKELKSDDMRSGARKKKPLGAVWKKKVGEFCRNLEEIDFEELGEDRGAVEEKLRGLELVIQEKLIEEGSARRSLSGDGNSLT